LAVVVAHDKTGGLFLNGPRRREAAGVLKPQRDYLFVSEFRNPSIRMIPVM
jgi:hypothetical protein